MASSRRPVILLFRGSYKAAGLGRLAMAWTALVFPKGGKTLTPALFVTARGGEKTRAALEIHGLGGIIRAGRSKYLAVPTNLAGKFVSTAAGRERVTPKLFEQRTGIKLQFVPRRGSRPALLVASDVRVSPRGRVRNPKGGSRTKAGRFKSGISTAVVFVLVPMVVVRQRADLRALKRKAGALVSDHVSAGVGDAVINEAAL